MDYVLACITVTGNSHFQGQVIDMEGEIFLRSTANELKESQRQTGKLTLQGASKIGLIPTGKVEIVLML